MVRIIVMSLIGVFWLLLYVDGDWYFVFCVWEGLVV